MKAALDRAVLREARACLERYGANDPLRRADNALAQASSKQARAAMRAALDKQVFTEAKTSAERYGANDPLQRVQQTLSRTSSKRARAAMERLLPKPEANSGFTPPIFEMPDLEDLFGRSYEDFLRGAFDEERFRTIFEQARQQARGGQRAHTPPPRAEAPPAENPKLTEVRRIVAKVVASDRQYSWLQREDPKVVLRVVNTVRRLRANATDQQVVISDREIYIIYRRKIETPDSSPELETSFRIIDALMGGKVSGKLPF
jgi:hypothetical protein